MTSSNFVSCITGRSAGFAPFSIVPDVFRAAEQPYRVIFVP